MLIPKPMFNFRSYNVKILPSTMTNKGNTKDQNPKFTNEKLKEMGNQAALDYSL